MEKSQAIDVSGLDRSLPDFEDRPSSPPGRPSPSHRRRPCRSRLGRGVKANLRYSLDLWYWIQGNDPGQCDAAEARADEPSITLESASLTSEPEPAIFRSKWPDPHEIY